VESITKLPYIVINTHGHPDHAGGNGSFKEVWLNPKDLQIMKTMCADSFRVDDITKSSKVFGTDPEPLLKRMVKYGEVNLLPYDDGTVFNLGERCFTAYAVPGHTPGSMALYNAGEKILFAGDSVVTTHAWLYLDHSTPLQTYYESLTRLRNLTPGVRTIFTGHLPTMAAPDLMDDLILCAGEIIENPGRGEAIQTFAGQGILWTHGKGQIIYDPKKVKAAQSPK
jgi:glyoxylase-like metal-dependent hydrolase (beta-lactamase superfamily II)